jgi:hypothetical protein
MRKFTLIIMMVLFALMLTTYRSNSQNILVVDRDGSLWAPDSFTDEWPIFQEVLDDIGYDYYYWEVINATDDGPDQNFMSDYDIVIWFCGEVWANIETLTVNDEFNLTLYLEGGGKLFLSAQDYLWDRYPDAGTFNPGEFPYDYLGLREVTQDVWNIDTPNLAYCEGVEGSFAEGYTFEIQDIYTTSRDGLFIDNITNHVGTSLFKLTEPAPEGIIATQYEVRSFKTVFTTGSYAGIVEYGDRIDLMIAIVNWLMGAPVCYPYFDDFDSYTAGSNLAVQAPCWNTWSGNPGSSEDALITEAQAYSGTQSVLVEGSTDEVFQLGLKTSGQYEISFYLYIEPEYVGYFDIFHFINSTTDYEQGLAVFFEPNGTGYISDGGENTATFTYPPGNWFACKTLIDIDDDYAELYINGNFIHSWQWSLTFEGVAGANQLSDIGFYAWFPVPGQPKYFLDDFKYEATTGVGFSEYNPKTGVSIFPNPASDMISIFSMENIREISIYNNLGQLVYNESLDNNYLTVNTSDYENGIYIVRVRTEKGIKLNKLLIK